MNLTAYLNDMYRRLNQPTSPPTSVTTRFTAYLNETYRELASLPGMERLRDSVEPITAYANTARTGLPPNVARIHNITDRSNNFTLQQVPLKLLRLTDPAQAFTGSYPYRYSVIGEQAVMVQPTTSGSGLWAASSATADTTQKIYVESVTVGGYPNQPLTTGTAVNGTTRAAIGSLTTHIEVTKFYSDLVGVGSFSLYDAAVAGNELARIPIGQTFSRMLAVEWFPIQTANVIGANRLILGQWGLLTRCEKQRIAG